MMDKAMDKAPVEVRKKIEEVKKFYKSHWSLFWLVRNEVKNIKVAVVGVRDISVQFENFKRKMKMTIWGW